ncbi:MAG: flavin reductase family protein [Fibrobacter sp.]|nr:flavin reductase family protein [Fibrobacter sp.]
MRKNFGVKPWVYPQPVFIIAAYDENGKANAMNAAWGGVSEANQIAVCISPEHKTTKNIEIKKAFTVSMATVSMVAACDYVGVVSGNDEADKMGKAGFNTVKSEFVDAPVIEELPMTVECKLIRYNPETCILLGEIVNVSADSAVLDENGKIDVDKLGPVTFDPIHNTYRVLGKVVGNAFSDGMTLK